MPSTVHLVLAASLFGAAMSHPALAMDAEWPDTPTGRLEALAVLQTLNADLLSHDSATLTLERWCEAHGLARDAKVTAERLKGESKTPPDEVRRQLKIGPQEALAYRRVRLRCGELILSDADNWYVPSLLTPEMNARLNETDTPFGRVVQPLQFQRHTLSAELLWHPLPQDWDRAPKLQPAGAGSLAIPEAVLRHRAVLTRSDGTPFSFVQETYRREVLAFEPPAPGN